MFANSSSTAAISARIYRYSELFPQTAVLVLTGKVLLIFK